MVSDVGETDPDGPDADWFRSQTEYHAADILTRELREHRTGTLPTTRVGEQVLTESGVDPTSRRVDLVRAIMERQGVPLGRGARAYLDGDAWIVRNRDGTTERLVDWKRRMDWRRGGDS